MEEEKNKIKIVSWEATKVVIIVCCIVIMCANMFLLANYNNTLRGIDAIYDAIHYTHDELKQEIIKHNHD